MLSSVEAVNVVVPLLHLLLHHYKGNSVEEGILVSKGFSKEARGSMDLSIPFNLVNLYLLPRSMDVRG